MNFLNLKSSLKPTLKLALLFMVVVLGLGVNYIFADWQGPLGDPPTGNIDVPVNVSINEQTKRGALRAGGLHSLTSLRVDGKVGIGTGANIPAATLHINQNGNNYASIQLGNDEENKGFGIIKAADSGSNSLGFWSGKIGGPTTQRMTILQNGNVGIGASDPTEKLHVAGNINLPATGILKINGQAGTDGQVLTRTATGMNWMDSSGGDGGGTPNLQQVTDVGATTNDVIRVAPSGSGLAAVAFGTNSNDNYFIGRPANQSYFNIFDVANNRDILRGNVSGNLLLQPNGGNVGVGIAPTQKLDINGKTLFRGDISFSSGAKDVDIPSGTFSIKHENSPKITFQGANTGHVGINEFVPASDLHVVKKNRQNGSFPTLTVTGVGAGGGNGQSVIALTTEYALGNNLTSDYDPNYGHSQGWGIIARGFNENNSNDLAFGFWSSRTGGWKQAPMVLKTNGDLTIAGSLSQSSDLNLKEKISNLSNSLEKILQLNGVNFEWKDDKTNQKNIGFIAQEVKKIFPELVKGEEGNMSVDYVSLVPVLVEAVQELNQKNQDLEARLNILEEKLDALTN